jgi:hypothetical protein
MKAIASTSVIMPPWKRLLAFSYQKSKVLVYSTRIEFASACRCVALHTAGGE